MAKIVITLEDIPASKPGTETFSVQVVASNALERDSDDLTKAELHTLAFLQAMREMAEENPERMTIYGEMPGDENRRDFDLNKAKHDPFGKNPLKP